VFGGILAGCTSTAMAFCRATAIVSAGRTVIAHTAPELLGPNEFGYLSFALTPASRGLLARSAGNQLGARLTLADMNRPRPRNIALVAFR
jgi:hypothetical protein